MLLRVALTTWNVGGAAASPGGVPPDARALLRALDARADVAVVGLQEVPWPGRGWKAALLAGLGPGWCVRAGCRYLGMRIVVLVRDRARDRVVALQAMRVGSGVADRFPNKGAVAVELALDKTTTACFVVAHLAAQEGNIKEREEDWTNIVRRLQNADTLAADGINVPLFMRYDHVFVMGDLNYRLVPKVGSTLAERVAWVETRVQAADWQALAAVDELATERATGNVFVNFNEGPLNFPPTFKYDPGTTSAANYNAGRVPSYCDRVLWHSLPARSAMVNLDSYTTVNDIVASDHRPVRAVFDLETPPAPERIAIHSAEGLRIVLEFSFVRFIRFKKVKHAHDSRASLHKTARRERDAHPSVSSTPNTSSAGKAESMNVDLVTVVSTLDHLDDDQSPGTIADVDDDDSSSSSSSTSSSSGTEPGESSDSDTEDIFSGHDDEKNGRSRQSDTVVHGTQKLFNKLHVRRSRSPVPASHRNAVRNDVGTVDVASMPRRDAAVSTIGAANGRASICTPQPDQPSSASCRDDAFDGEFSSSDEEGLVGRLSHDLRALDLSSSGQLVRPPPVDAAIAHPQNCRPRELSSLRRLGHMRSHSGPSSSRTAAMNVILESTYNPVKRDSVADLPTSQRGHSAFQGHKKRRKSRNPTKTWLMDVHGASVFLDPDRVYRAEIPKCSNGSRECGSESLPAIPLMPVRDIHDVQYEHLQISFWRAKSRMGLSGVLPLRMLLDDPLEPYSFELKLTKYGREAGLLEACVRLTVSDSRLWLDSQRQVVRTASGLSSKFYLGPLTVRKKARKGARFSSHAAKTAQSARAVTKIIVHKLDSFGSDKG